MASSFIVDPKWKKSLRGIRGGLKDIRGHFTHLTIDENPANIGRNSPEELDPHVIPPDSASRAKKCPSRQWMRKRKSADSPPEITTHQNLDLEETPTIPEPSPLTVSVPHRRFASEFDEGMVDRTLLVSNRCVTTETIPLSIAASLAPKTQQDPDAIFIQQDRTLTEVMSDATSDNFETNLEISSKLCHWFRDIPPCPRLSNGYPIHDIWPLGDDIKKAVDIVEGLPSRSYVWPDEARWLIRTEDTHTSRVFGPYSGTGLDAAHQQDRLDIWWGYRRAGEQADFTDLGQWKHFCGGSHRPFQCPYYGYRIEVEPLDPLTTLPEPKAIENDACRTEPTNRTSGLDQSYTLNHFQERFSEQKRNLVGRLLTIIEELCEETEVEGNETASRINCDRGEISKFDCKVHHCGGGRSRIEFSCIKDNEEADACLDDYCHDEKSRDPEDADHECENSVINGHSTQEESRFESHGKDEAETVRVVDTSEHVEPEELPGSTPAANTLSPEEWALKQSSQSRASKVASTESEILDRDWIKIEHNSSSHLAESPAFGRSINTPAEEEIPVHIVSEHLSSERSNTDGSSSYKTLNNIPDLAFGLTTRFDHVERCLDDIPEIAAGAARFSDTILQTPFAPVPSQLRDRGLMTDPQSMFIRHELYAKVDQPNSKMYLKQDYASWPMIENLQKRSTGLPASDKQSSIPEQMNVDNKPCGDGAQPTLVERMVRKFSGQSSAGSVYTEDLSSVSISECSIAPLHTSNSRSSSASMPVPANVN